MASFTFTRFFLISNPLNIARSTTMRIFILIGFLFTIAITTSAQTARWEVGLQAMGATYKGDLSGPSGLYVPETKPGASLFLRRNVTPQWSVRTAATVTQLSGKDAHFDDDPFYKQRNFSFKSPIAEGALLLEWDPLGRQRYRKSNFHRTISPYVFGGIGILHFNPTVDFNSTTMEGVQDGIKVDKTRPYNAWTKVIPAGLGLRFDMGRTWTLALEASAHLPMSDYLDGISQAGNPNQRDQFFTAGLSINKRFGLAKDRDHDKVMDQYDQCPDVAGEVALGGCPDADKDGVPDKADKCPFNKGDVHLQGCPDKDKDGTPDPEDDCPTIAGPTQLHGCPDTDKDGIRDIDDACPNVIGSLTAKGCPDADRDSIADALDKCPSIAGLVINKGCPDMDSDKDGIIDRLDPCPEVAGTAAFKGCPDTDGDSVPDSEDECPTFKGLLASKGCPDVDNDSIPDFRDRCPEQSGLAANNGCPDVDTDKDGIADRLDACPQLAGRLSTNGCPDADGDGIEDTKDECPGKYGPGNMHGCPDTDGDGISDARDRCPDNAGLLNMGGCPEIKKEEQEVLKIAMQKVEFDFAKSTLRAASFPILNRVAELMEKYTGHHLKVDGHTDDIGSDRLNLSLSVERAEACRRYLAQRGIQLGRIEAKGYGETKPLLPNTNAENRQINRRVEFHLYVPELKQ